MRSFKKHRTVWPIVAFIILAALALLGMAPAILAYGLNF